MSNLIRVCFVFVVLVIVNFALPTSFNVDAGHASVENTANIEQNFNTDLGSGNTNNPSLGDESQNQSFGNQNDEPEIENPSESQGDADDANGSNENANKGEDEEINLGKDQELSDDKNAQDDGNFEESEEAQTGNGNHESDQNGKGNLKDDQQNESGDQGDINEGDQNNEENLEDSHKNENGDQSGINESDQGDKGNLEEDVSLGENGNQENTNENNQDDASQSGGNDEQNFEGEQTELGQIRQTFYLKINEFYKSLAHFDSYNMFAIYQIDGQFNQKLATITEVESYISCIEVINKCQEIVGKFVSDGGEVMPFDVLLIDDYNANTLCELADSLYEICQIRQKLDNGTLADLLA